MIRLMLMVEIPGVVATPMDRVPWDASEANSNSSWFHRQAVTPGKPHGGIVGQVTSNAHTGWEGLDEVGVSSWGVGGFDGPAQENQIGPPFGLGGPQWVGYLPSGYHGSWAMQDLFPSQEFWTSPLCAQFWCTGCLGDVSRHSFWALIILPLRKGHSLTLSAKGQKSRFLGRLHFSTQYWRLQV